MRFLVFFIVLAILAFLLEKIMIKLFGIDKTKKISETPGKNINRWGRGIILAILLCSIPFFITREGTVMKWYYLLLLSSTIGFQTIL